MKSFSQHIKESLAFKRLDSEQVFKLYTGEIDTKTFAMNCDIEEEDADKVQNIIKTGAIKIVNTDQMSEKYAQDDVQSYIDDIDSYVDLGVRYGTQINQSPDEKKDRESTEKAIADSEGRDEKETVDSVDDSQFVSQVNIDFVGVDNDAIKEYFWRKSGNVGYLYFILDSNKEIDELVDKL